MKTPSSAARFQNITSADMPSPSVLAQRNKNQSSPAQSLIDLTDLPSSPVEPTSSALVNPEAKQPRKGRGPGRKILNNAPSISEADGWTYDDLIKNQDRRRLLIKLIRDMGPVKRNALWKTWQELMHKKFCLHLKDALTSIISHEATPPPDGSPVKNENPRVQIMKHCARLLLAFHFCRSDICRGGDKELPADVLSHASKPGDNDIKMFVHLLTSQLVIKDNALFSSPIQVKYDEAILIDSDDDLPNQDLNSDHFKLERPPESARKRRKVELDLVAADKRSAARARMEESQNHQSSNPSALQQMVLPDFSAHHAGSKVINSIRKPGQDPIYIEQKIAEKMKPYQLDGVQFLWRELTGDLDKAQGCLLAHTMGLGKTMQSIALLCAVDAASQSPSTNIVHQLPEDLRLSKDDRNKRSLRFLVICPPSLIQNWERELKQWAHPKAFGGSIISVDTAKAGSGYIQKLQHWSKRGGVLLIGYQIFARLAPGDSPTTAKDDQAKDEPSCEVAEMARHILTHDAELIVADEAHTIKNQGTKTAKAASKFRSTARIALTGTPMSNDVDEIYSIISWVTPGFLGDKRQFGDHFGVPIKEGLYMDSTAYAKRKSTITLKSLHHEIEPKVHRADIEVLKCELKPKVEFVLTVELTQQQHDAYAGALLGPNGDLAKIIQHQTLFLAWSARTVDCASKLFSQYEEPSQNQESELSRGRPWSGHAHNEDADIGEANEDLPFNTLVNIRRR